MSIVGNIAGIAKGMSITFREMLRTHPGRELSRRARPPARSGLRAALPRRARVAARRERPGEVRGLLPVRRRLPLQLHLHRSRREHRRAVRISSSERYAKVYNIDYNRCIFCGYCVEACPTDAITHGHGFELATLNATNLVMRKEDMLVPVAALAGEMILGLRSFVRQMFHAFDKDWYGVLKKSVFFASAVTA